MNKLFITLQYAYLLFIVLSIPLIAEEEKVLAKVSYAFPLALPGEVIEVKRIRTKTANVKYITSSHEYNTIEKIYQLKRQERELTRNKYGTITGALQLIFDSMAETGSVEVEVYYTRSVTDQVLQRLGISPNKVRREGASRKLITFLTKQELKQIMRDNDILSIIKYRKLKPTSGGDEQCDDCDPELFNNEKYFEAHFNFPEDKNEMPLYGQGSGVKAGVYEDHDYINEDFYTRLDGTYPVDLINIDKAGPNDPPATPHEQMALHCVIGMAQQSIAFNKSDIGELMTNKERKIQIIL